MDNPVRFERHVDITADIKLVDCLAAQTQLSKAVIKQALHHGCGWLTKGKHTQRVRRADKVLQAGQTLHFYYDENIMAAKPEAPVLIADEDVFSVWVKPRGMYSQGSRWGDHCTINRWVEVNAKPQRPAFIVHRLDRGAGGLMLLAHTKKVAAVFSQAFADRTIEKHYRVIVHGCVTSKEEPLLVNEPIDGKAAKSIVTLLEYDAGLDQSLLQVKIETGRKHQIRRHLAGLGHPVVGDSLYGLSEDNNTDLQLTAFTLSFIHPVLNTQVSYHLPEQYCPKLS